jgi:replicative DNA helicase
VAIFLYRDGYYDPESPEKHIIEFWIRKNRLGGPAGEVVNMLWLGRYMRCGKIK